VTETNLIQRSFTDLSHSERAEAIGMHYQALKQKGRDDELIKEVEKILSPLGTKPKSIRDVGVECGLSKNTIARYLRINKLIPELKVRLDGDGIGDKLLIRTAVSLSYLSEDEQKIVDDLLAGSLYHIDMYKAEAIRKQAEEQELTADDIKSLLSDS